MKYFKLMIVLFCLTLFLQGKTALGHKYTVIRDNSPYAAEEGDREIKMLHKGMIVRLIKDETVAETLVLAPFRIIRIMVNIEPRGNWLVEDNKGNRGYMWDSDLEYLKR